jgi:hypothetical protein
VDQFIGWLWKIVETIQWHILFHFNVLYDDGNADSIVFERSKKVIIGFSDGTFGGIEVEWYLLIVVRSQQIFIQFSLLD